MVKLNDLMKDFDIDQSAQVLDIANAVDVVREKMCAKIDRHIKRYIRGEVEYIENKSKKVVKKKVDCLHKATSQANMKAIFLKYGPAMCTWSKGSLLSSQHLVWGLGTWNKRSSDVL